MQTMRRILVALVLSSALAGPLAAGPWEDGAEAYARQDYATALRLWRPLAEAGHYTAQAFLGEIYENGKGVPLDYAEALKWYRKAADLGDSNAQVSLGRLYQQGKGIRRDDSEALSWYRKAASRENPRAHFYLGNMYHRGEGVRQDYVEAFRWYRKGADGGNAAALYSLGLMYDRGEGVPQNYVQAHMWYNLAAARFTATEADGRALAVNGRDTVAGKMTPAQIAEAQKLASEWKPWFESWFEWMPRKP